MSDMFRSFMILTAFTAFLVGTAHATTPEAPSLKPTRVFQSSVTDANNALILHEALKAKDDRQWSRLSDRQNQASDPAVKDAITWLRASEGVPGMRFDEITYAMRRLSDWPDTGRMLRRAEDIVEESSLSDGERIAWFNASPPRTGVGKIAFANSLMRAGETDRAKEFVRDAWRNNSLDTSHENTARARYGHFLTQADHQARAELLLWTNQRSAARRLKPLLSNDYRKLVDARNTLASRGRGVDRYVNAVPASLQDNPGLLYERARWRRKAGNQQDATPLLVNIDGATIPEAGRSKLWDERNYHLRTDLKDGNWERAYLLASNHGLTEGADFAEAEWIAGWIALRLPGKAQDALDHFLKMTSGVSTPISLSRGQYWTGRAYDALGDEASALTAYGAATSHKVTYYGQLAAERMKDTLIAFDPVIAPTEAQIEAFEARPLVKALRLWGETGETGLFRKFAYHLDDQLVDPVEFVLLAGIADEYQASDIGVRGAKAGLAKGIVSPDAAYPVVTYPLLREPYVERPLMLALSRQESEMNPSAISHAGARGLMQFMPRTAQLEARKRGLPYRKSWLTDDPGYNMTLGGQHLDTLLSQFNGSYIMTAAAYNAGPSRPRQWIKDYGDPRLGEIDPIDWVELIPFSETRNYVQRVLENTQVYRHRISGEPVEIRLSEDLKRGG
jgi:soluble lytic murein transglycosylase